MIFKSKKKEFFLTIDTPETVTEPAATPVAVEPTPVVTEPAPAPKATVKAKTQKSPVAEAAPVVTPAVIEPPAAIVEESPYAFFPSRRTPGPSLTMFMNMARDMRR